MATSLPLPVRLAVLGLGSTVLLVTSAVALRTSPHAALEEDVGAPSSSAAASVSAPSATSPALSDRPGSVPTPTPRATARPAASPAEPAVAPSGDGREARALLRRELQFGRYPSATAALARLLEIDPRAAEDGEVRADVVELAQRVMLLTGDEPGRVFEMISRKMGTTGLDILYELVTTRGGSRAATRADELLGDERVRALGTPALRIAFEMRSTPDCEKKKALLPRARTDGDGRTLGQLQLLNRHCGRHAAACCLHNDPDLRQTMDAIKAQSN